MKADNRVSVVVPNYNGIAFVERCFKALIKDAPKAELLLVDNGSTDGSRELTARHRYLCVFRRSGLLLLRKITASAGRQMRE